MAGISLLRRHGTPRKAPAPLLPKEPEVRKKNKHCKSRTVMASVVQAANATSLIHDIETGEFLQDDSHRQWWEKLGTVALLALVLGTASIVFNLLSMIFYSEQAAVLVMGIIALLLAPAIMYRQIQTEDKGGMRKVQNKLRENVNELSNENTKLCGQANELGAQVGKLQHCETELGEITKDSAQDIDSFAKLVKENGEILEEMKRVIMGQAINLVIGTFLDSDKDESGQLDEKESRHCAFG